MINQQFPHVRADIRPERYATTPCILDSGSLLSISIDVHDMWRSSLEPGDDTPFASDFITVDGEEIDLANTHRRDLPVPLQELSVGSGALILTMINTHLAYRDEMQSMHVEKMSVMLFSVWDVLKRNRTLSTARGSEYPDSDLRIKILDQRLVLAGIASLFSDERYPLWKRYYHMDVVRELPGIRRYGDLGQRILDTVRTKQRPVPIASELDSLYDA